ncbi:MAG: TIGR01459 family HAD-type hydrolase [Rhizobiaceae bacterium]|nr:TIGR01459 family HAD-type hydrolase [Rhizobiaceae bacterium]
MPKRISGLSAIAPNYRAILCDVWGVLHNGQSVYRQAEDALVQYRKAGGQVVLLTNSPRPNQGVASQLDDLEVSRQAFDAIVTSGDVTRTLIEQTAGDVFLLGPDRDLPLFDGLGKNLVDAASCETIVCTGLFEDEKEVPEDHRDRLSDLAARQIPFICANPDLVVERGERMIYCAGSLAKLYDELGGQTFVAGKPHSPIYNLAMKRLEEINGTAMSQDNVIAVGDGMPTDVAGALSNGFDLLYISAGIHSTEYGPADDPNEAELEKFLANHEVEPTVWMPRLSWKIS